MTWTIIDTDPASADENMRIDRDLLLNLREDSAPILRFYSWKNLCATYGYFLNPQDHINPEAITHLELARRPTGGGILFHSWDLTFSVLMPSHHSPYSTNTLENYAFINKKVADSLSSLVDFEPYLLDQPEEGELNFCMASPVQYDVMVDGRKVAGGAQRKTKKGYLHQGSISVITPNVAFLKNFLSKGLMEKMVESSFYLSADERLYDSIVSKLKKELAYHFLLSE